MRIEEMSGSATTSPPIRIFIIYAPREERSLDRLLEELAPLSHQGKITICSGRDVPAGGHRKSWIRGKLEESDLVLLLHSPSLYASDECCRDQIPVAMARHHAEAIPVVPIMVRGVPSTDPDIAELQPVPWNRRPLSDWPSADEAWCDVAFRITELVENMLVGGRPGDEPVVTVSFVPFRRIVSEIGRSIAEADHLWLLTRSGRGWWRDFPEIDKIFARERTGEDRLLVMDPECEAFEIFRYEWHPWHFNKKQTFEEYREAARRHLHDLLEKERDCGRTVVGKLDKISPLVVLMVNPGLRTDGRSVMFVEYPMLYSSPVTHMKGATETRYQQKPFIRIYPHNHEFYDRFLGSYDELWEVVQTGKRPS